MYCCCANMPIAQDSYSSWNLHVQCILRSKDMYNYTVVSLVDDCCRDLQSATQRLELTEFEVKFTSLAIVSPQLPFTWLIKATVDQLIYHARQQRQHQLCCFLIVILRCWYIVHCWNLKAHTECVLAVNLRLVVICISHWWHLEGNLDKLLTCSRKSRFTLCVCPKLSNGKMWHIKGVVFESLPLLAFTYSNYWW